MPARTSASPSPPPSAPTSTVPGPRATALHKIYTSALKATLSSNSYANFSSCFPTPAKYCPTALEGVWKQLNNRLEEECTKDFEKICIERNVVQTLNGWDQAVEDAKIRKAEAPDDQFPPRALHTFSGQELYDAQVIPFLLDSEAQLKSSLLQTQNSNSEAMDEIRRQRDEIAQLLSGLETLTQDVESAAKILESETPDLKKDTWAIEQEHNLTK